MFTEDLTPLFADFGVTATYGALTAQVLLDMPDQQIFGDMQMSTEYAITYKAGDLTGLKRTDSITVNAIAYTVREVTRVDDGALMHATLSK